MDPRKKFRFGESVGRDQLGEVYRAEDSNGHVLAIKIFDGWTVERGESREAYARSLAILRAIKPKRTPPILGYRLREENSWLATQWIDSTPLSAYLANEGELDEQGAATIACGVLDALAELHESGFAHGGITPSKVLLTNGLDAGGVVISDPFQHNLYDVTNPIETLQSGGNRFIGLPEYFSPEQAQGARPDLRSDIYVIGLIIYKMLTGRTPFESGNPSIILKRQIHEQPLPPRLVKPGIEISTAFEEIIQQSLAKDPGARFDSPRAMRAAIASVRDDFDADSEMSAAPLGPYPTSAEVPDDDTHSAGGLSTGGRTSENTPIALGALSQGDDVSRAVIASPETSSPFELLDDIDSEDSPFEALDENHAAHAYDGADEGTLEAIEDFATLAAEFDYGFDDEHTNSWFAMGDDAEEMADLHGDETPASPKDAERVHNRTFFFLVPLALIGTLIAVLVMTRNSGDSEVDEENTEEVAANEDNDENAVEEGSAALAAVVVDAGEGDAPEMNEVTDDALDLGEVEADEAEVEGAAAAAVAADDSQQNADEEHAAEDDRPTQTARRDTEEQPRERERERDTRRDRESEPAPEQTQPAQQAAAATTPPASDNSGQGTTGTQTQQPPAATTPPVNTQPTEVAVAEPEDPAVEAERRRVAEEAARQRAEERRREEEEAARQAAQAETVTRQAQSALNSGNLDQARRLYNEALMLNSGSREAHSGLGDTYFRMGEYQRAVPHHQAAGRYRDVGMDYFRLNDFPKALQAFERAAASGDQNAQRYVDIVRQRMAQ